MKVALTLKWAFVPRINGVFKEFKGQILHRRFGPELAENTIYFFVYGMGCEEIPHHLRKGDEGIPRNSAINLPYWTLSYGAKKARKSVCQTKFYLEFNCQQKTGRRIFLLGPFICRLDYSLVRQVLDKLRVLLRVQLAIFQPSSRRQCLAPQR